MFDYNNIFAVLYLELKLNLYIRKFTALLLLVIFSLSSTPKRFLHHVFANHTDCVTYQQKSFYQHSISKHTFHCQIDQLVVESPFENTEFFLSTHLLTFSENVKSKCNQKVLSQYISNKSLRGPPVF